MHSDQNESSGDENDLRDAMQYSVNTTIYILHGMKTNSTFCSLPSNSDCLNMFLWQPRNWGEIILGVK